MIEPSTAVQSDMGSAGTSSGFEVVVRAAERADLPGLVELEQRTFEVFRMSRKALRRMLQSPSVSVLVALVHGKLVGSSVAFQRSGVKVVRLYSIATAAELRGRGVGSLLLRAVETEAATRGYEELRLEVRAADAAARRFYERAGFSTLVELPDYYGSGVAGLRLRKALGLRKVLASRAPSSEV